MPCESSALMRMDAGAAASQKLGQPEPESYLVVDENRPLSQTMVRYPQSLLLLAKFRLSALFSRQVSLQTGPIRTTKGLRRCRIALDWDLSLTVVGLSMPILILGHTGLRR